MAKTRSQKTLPLSLKHRKNKFTNKQNHNTMKTKKHGNGLSHEQVIRFSNRLAASAQTYDWQEENAYYKGWKDACKYFAHKLREELRYQETLQD